MLRLASPLRLNSWRQSWWRLRRPSSHQAISDHGHCAHPDRRSFGRATTGKKKHEKLPGMMCLPGAPEFELLVLDLLTLNRYKREDFYK
jgi:hypothetical protein